MTDNLTHYGESRNRWAIARARASLGGAYPGRLQFRFCLRIREMVGGSPHVVSKAAQPTHGVHASQDVWGA